MYNTATGQTTAPVAVQIACEALLDSGLGACAAGQAGKYFCEPAPQDGAQSARGVTPLCQPTRNQQLSWQ